MIKNIIFDIGNVILGFDREKILPEFVDNIEEQEFIEENIINSPEWLGYGLLDNGYLTIEEIISQIQDRTNHKNDHLVEKFLKSFPLYLDLYPDVIDIVKRLKDKGYNIYLLSNMCKYEHESIKDSELFNYVDGYVLSYQEHQIKPYEGIYNTILNRYNLKANESIFIDDNEKNIETANRLGIIGLKVEPDSYDSIIEVLKEKGITID
ncbi:MAG: HAD family phosphatase [Bacilli bacterium]|nr:HAD family phosphatase [Bacilli bacterium]